MTLTLNPNLNGRNQRKSLASQLDRLDTMLDGLDQGLQGAITDAVKEAVTVAVAEAVRSTLFQVATNPEIHALARSSLTSLIQQAMPQQPPPPTGMTVQQAAPQRNAVSRAWNCCVGELKSIRERIAQRIRKIRNGIASAYRQANSIWRLRRPVLIALGVGAVVGVAGYAASPWLAGLVSGVAASGMVGYVVAFSTIQKATEYMLERKGQTWEFIMVSRPTIADSLKQLGISGLCLDPDGGSGTLIDFCPSPSRIT